MEIILNILTLSIVILLSLGFISNINRTFPLSADFSRKIHFFVNPGTKKRLFIDHRDPFPYFHF